MTAVEALCANVGPLAQRNTAKRMMEHVLAQLACLGTHTVAGVVSVCGRQFQDWSADYRLYERDRMVPELLFEPVRQWLCENQQGPVVVALDDTRLRKTGTKIPGAQYVRDPMGPPLRVNFIRADAKLYDLPHTQPDTGRRRVYGEPAPTPEQVRQDEQIPWKPLRVFFGGAVRELRVKQLTAVRWRTAGQNHTLQLLVIAPTPYRLSKHS